MPRTSRLIRKGERSVYHVISRTALEGFPLGDVEKDFMLEVIKRYAQLYFVEILGFCLMGNHFHLVVGVLPESEFSDEDIRGRYRAFYGSGGPLGNGQIPILRRKLSSLSEFVREIKVNFSRYYNKRHARRGYFWGDRFKSVLVEKGETLIHCLAYVDLNPLRAGVVERPEDYRWSSLGYHVQTGNGGGLLSLDFGLKEFGVHDPEEALRHYRKYIYEAGALARGDGKPAGVIDTETLERERKKKYRITRAERFRYRTRYFTDSGIIGTREFVLENYRRFKGVFRSVREKMPKAIAGLEGIYSLKRLAEEPGLLASR